MTDNCFSGVLKPADIEEAKNKQTWMLPKFYSPVHFPFVSPLYCGLASVMLHARHFSTFPYLVWHPLLLAFHLCPVQISPSALFIWTLAVFRNDSFPFLPTRSEGLSISPSNLYILISQTVWSCGIWTWLLLGYCIFHMKVFFFNVCFAWLSFLLSQQK